MPMAASQVDMTTESRRILSTFTPAARAKVGFEPTAVMAVPVLVWRNAHISQASSAKNSSVPVGIERFPMLICRKFARTLS